MNTKVIIYQGKKGEIEFKGDVQNETIWATQAQIAELFSVDIRTANEHVKNIFNTKELEEKSTIRKIRIVQKEGARNVNREVNSYNLDMIIAVGYRINSLSATKFRQWATKTLKEHLTQGFTINKKMIQRNYDKFLDAIEEAKKLLPVNSETLSSGQVLDLTKLFTDTWMALDAYDKQDLQVKKITKFLVDVTANDLTQAIEKLKKELIKKGQATNLFANDRNKNILEGIVGNVMQSLGGKHVYDSVEEKAAHLLYFIIKNHPFSDGNKRTGAFAFVWYLEKNKRLDIGKVSPSALTAFTILVAESNPAHKENVVKLIMKLIER
jgi:prophage maintenance system killer protein